MKQDMHDIWKTYNPACPWHIRIGKLFISPGIEMENVWIGECESGEGGEFSREKLAEVIERFYHENF